MNTQRQAIIANNNEDIIKSDKTNFQSHTAHTAVAYDSHEWDARDNSDSNNNDRKDDEEAGRVLLIQEKESDTNHDCTKKKYDKHDRHSHHSSKHSKHTKHSKHSRKHGMHNKASNNDDLMEVETMFSALNDDTNMKILEFEHEISELIRMDNGCHASFRYSQQGDVILCKLVTWNPTHRSTFLTHQCEAMSREEALYKMLMYVKDHIRGPDRSYTVTWRAKNSSKLVTSHFFAYDIYGLLDKFYYDKQKSQFIIYQIKLNPES